MITHLIHLADIHIRCGDEEQSRFKEYSTVFHSLFENLKQLPCVQQQTAYIVVCGDIFHHKNKLDAHSLLLWDMFIQGLTHIAPTILICGNHDYRQEDPNTPDLIDAVVQSFQSTAFPCHYLKHTGTYVFENIEFGLVCIKDTLDAYNTSGTIDQLPPFPKPLYKDTLPIALFHGTITQSSLPGGQSLTPEKGYALEWFYDYPMLLLGDNHKQQARKTHQLHWAYPGSLVQQDIGEPVQGHGYMLWDLETQSPTPITIYNPYSRLKAKLCDKKLYLKAAPEEDFYPIPRLHTNPWFPKHPQLVFYGSPSEEYWILSELKTYAIEHSSLKFTSACVLPTHSQPSKKTPKKIVHYLNQSDCWLDYIASSDPSFADTLRNLRWISDPKQLLMEILPSQYSEELHRLTTEYRQHLTKAIQAYEKITDDIQRSRHEVVLKHMAWDWTFSYGEKNWFDFEKLEHRFGILGGRNATGKSAFIDTTCIALFGEPSLNRQIHCSKKMGIHCIHSQRPKSAQSSAMNTRILLSVDNQLYELERQYQQSQTDAECKPLQMNLWRIEQQERTLVASGSTLVGQWVETHIGTIDDMMRTAFVGQMDNHNFFFAKPDVQKEMIDQAVNLRELQAYSNILYDALSHYTQLLKTIGTILQATESTSILSDTEIEDKRLRLDTIQQQITVLQPQKESLAECLGAFRTQRPPTEVPESFWEELLSEAPEDWRALLEAGREQRQRLLYEREKYPTFTETLDSSVSYANLLGEQQTLYETHVAQAPPAHRPRSAIETELESVQEWMASHATWVKDSTAFETERAHLIQSLDETQSSIDHWMKQKPHKIEEIPQRSKRSTPKFDDWEQAVANYHSVRAAWTTAQDLHRRLDVSRPKAKYPEWCDSWEAFQELERECEANEWTDESALQTQLNKVNEYLQLRSSYQQHIDTLTTQCDSIKHKLSKYPTWKKDYELWKTHQAQRGTYDLTILNAYKNRLEAEQHLKDLTAAQAPWRKEWAVWNKQAQRCIKYQWGSIDQLREQLDNARSNLQKFQTHQERYASRIQERDTFMAAHPHPECAVCSTRLASIQSELEALLHEMPQSENEWNKAIVYYEKALETRRFVESLRASMETTLERYETEVQKWESILKQSEPVPKGQTLEDIESLIHQCNQWDAEKDKESTYVWLSELEHELQELQKQWRRQTKKLESMAPESSLKDTERHWTKALESFRRVQSQRVFMKAEAAAWASAKAAWEALAEHGDISLNALADAWHQADAAWNAAGTHLRDQHHQLETQHYEMEHFQERYQEKHAWMERLQNERVDAETYETWNTERQAMEERIERLKQCVLEMELKEIQEVCMNLEPYETAERWNAWYKYTAIQEQLAQLDEERQTLRVELAVAGVSGNPGEATPTANARRAYLMQRQDQWMTIRDHLAKMNTYLVGERGRSKKDNETSTFKEWAYKTEILPALESDINQFLTDIEVDIQFQIEYHKRALKFLVHDRGNTTTYAASSGFQQFVIGLGMRQALINLGGGTRNLKHLFIDEGFTSCDVENLEKTKDILNTLVQMGEYRSILLVSHLDAVQDIADQRIPLERHGVFSKLTYGNPYPVASGSAKRRGRPPKKSVGV